MSAIFPSSFPAMSSSFRYWGQLHLDPAARAKYRAVGLEEIRKAHWPLPGNLFHSVVGSGKYAILMVFGDLLEVLPQGVALDLIEEALVLGGLWHAGGKFLHLVGINLLVVKRLADGVADLRCDLSEGVLFLAVQGIHLSNVPLRR